MQENPYAPPLSDVRKPQDNELVSATRWSRFLAAMIDTIISMIVLVPVMYLTGGFEQDSLNNAYGFGYTIFLVVSGLVVFILLHGYLLATNGQTIGKKVMGIRITDLDGNKAAIVKNLVPRYGFTTLLPLIPLAGNFLSLVDVLFIFRKPRRCVHDYIAKTIVVKN